MRQEREREREREREGGGGGGVGEKERGESRVKEHKDKKWSRVNKSPLPPPLPPSEPPLHGDGVRRGWRHGDADQKCRVPDHGDGANVLL